MIHGKLCKTCGACVYNEPAVVVGGIRVCDLTGNEHPEQWSGVIDTGADRTVVPLTICEGLGLSPSDKRRPSGFDPQAPLRDIPLYYVRVRVGGMGDVKLLVYGVPRSNLLLGRDFLRGSVLLVDNKRLFWQVGQHGIRSKITTRFLGLH